MAHHDLKLDTEFYPDSEQQLKMFEIRKNDRNYQVGDTLTLHRWCNLNETELGEYLERKIIYMTSWGQYPGWVVLGLVEI